MCGLEWPNRSAESAPQTYLHKKVERIFVLNVNGHKFFARWQVGVVSSENVAAHGEWSNEVTKHLRERRKSKDTTTRLNY